MVVGKHGATDLGGKEAEARVCPHLRCPLSLVLPNRRKPCLSLTKEGHFLLMFSMGLKPQVAVVVVSGFSEYLGFVALFLSGRAWGRGASQGLLSKLRVFLQERVRVVVFSKYPCERGRGLLLTMNHHV